MTEVTISQLHGVPFLCPVSPEITYLCNGLNTTPTKIYSLSN